MTKEEKELVLKDLCTRLPYGFIVHRYSDNCNITFGANEIDGFVHFLEYSEGEKFKPYLRPMSSMTEEEARTILELSGYKSKDILQVKISDECLEAEVDDGCCSFERHVIWYNEIVNSIQVFDFLVSKHFDYRGLIEKGLAIEASEENNPYK